MQNYYGYGEFYQSEVDAQTEMYNEAEGLPVQSLATDKQVKYLNDLCLRDAKYAKAIGADVAVSKPHSLTKTRASALIKDMKRHT